MASTEGTTTSSTPYFGLDLLQVEDFFQTASILHPFAIGSIAMVFLFGWLRLSSNRTVAPLTIWDEIVSIALGSTLAGIINGTSLVRGLLALTVLLIWQYTTSFIGCKLPKSAGRLFVKPPLVVGFRGHLLEGIMSKHRISQVDIYGALRTAGIFNVCEVECIVVEPTGVFSIFKTKDLPKDYDAEVLLSIKGYRDLVTADDEDKIQQKTCGTRSDSSDGSRTGETEEDHDQSGDGGDAEKGHVRKKGGKGEKKSGVSSEKGERRDDGKLKGDHKGDKHHSADGQKKDEDGQTKEDRIAEKAAHG